MPLYPIQSKTPFKLPGKALVSPEEIKAAQNNTNLNDYNKKQLRPENQAYWDKKKQNVYLTPLTPEEREYLTQQKGDGLSPPPQSLVEKTIIEPDPLIDPTTLYFGARSVLPILGSISRKVAIPLATKLATGVGDYVKKLPGNMWEQTLIPGIGRDLKRIIVKNTKKTSPLKGDMPTRQKGSDASQTARDIGRKINTPLVTPPVPVVASGAPKYATLKPKPQPKAVTALTVIPKPKPYSTTLSQRGTPEVAPQDIARIVEEVSSPPTVKSIFDKMLSGNKALSQAELKFAKDNRPELERYAEWYRKSMTTPTPQISPSLTPHSGLPAGKLPKQIEQGNLPLGDNKGVIFRGKITPEELQKAKDAVELQKRMQEIQDFQSLAF